MNSDLYSSSAAAGKADAGFRLSSQCRRGLLTRRFEPNGWCGRAAPRSPGQPRTELNELSARASQTTALRIPRDELEAQSLACTHLVLACRQAIDDLSLEGEHGAKTNERAVEILREIQCDWSTALKALRRLARR